MVKWTSVHQSRSGLEFYATPGAKSRFDFRVRYKKVNGRHLSPRHTHVIVDLLIKRNGDERPAQQLIGHLGRDVVNAVGPARSFPPRLSIFSRRRAARFKALDQWGFYSVEDVMVLVELLAIQERTNYPTGTLTQDLFHHLLSGADDDSVIGRAAFSGRR